MVQTTTSRRLAALVVVLCLVCGSSSSTTTPQERNSLQHEQVLHQYESLYQQEHGGSLRSLQVLDEEDPLLDDHNGTLVDDDHDDELFLNGTDTDHGADDEHDDEHDGHDGHDDHDSEASLFMDSSEDDSKPWGEVIVASILINLGTLVGVVFLTGEVLAKHVFKRDVAHSPYYHSFTHNIIPSFACGALLATTLFLVMPESLFLITAHFAGGEEEDVHDHEEDDHSGHAHRFLEDEGHEDHAEPNDGAAIWRFGTCVIAGFLLPVLTSMVFPHNHDGIEAAVAEEDASKASPATASETLKLRDVPEDVELEERAPLEESAPEPEDAGTLAAAAATTTGSQLDKKTSNMTTGSAASSDGSDIMVTTEDEPLPYAIDYSLAASIMAGDFFHNFAGTYA